MEQLGFAILSDRCSGCKTCQVACKDKNDLEIGPKFRRVSEFAGGRWQQDSDGAWHQNTFAYYISVSCNHCDDPACVKGCPTGAMHKREDNGLVLVNQDVCIGCRYCEMRCPYGAPQFDPTKKVMSKCDGCIDLVNEGKQPICIDSCPQRALEFGTISELRKKYGNERDIAPLPVSTLTQPNIVIVGHPDSEPNTNATGSLLNPQEV